MIRGEKNKLPVHPRMVEVERIVQLIANLGRETGDIDVEIGEFGLLLREMFERTVIALDQRRAFNMDEIAKHEAALDEVDQIASPLKHLQLL